jgi:hypothetical protein
MNKLVCDDCGSEVQLALTGLTDHGACSYGCHSSSYALRVAATCDCTKETAKATELTTIKFSGESPTGWSDD